MHDEKGRKESRVRRVREVPQVDLSWSRSYEVKKAREVLRLPGAGQNCCGKARRRASGRTVRHCEKRSSVLAQAAFCEEEWLGGRFGRRREASA